MHTLRRIGVVVRGRTTRVLLLLTGAAFLALHAVDAVAMPAAPAYGSDRAERDNAPMAVARFVHAAQLRLEQATVGRSAHPRLQQAPNDCALAVVGELHTMAGRAVPDRDWLAHTLALTPNGVELDRLAATLRQLGWPAHVTRGVADLRVQQLQPPAVALMRPGHYVLLVGRTATHVEYFDPLVGLVHQPLPPFEARWTGKSVQLSTRDN